MRTVEAFGRTVEEARDKAFQDLGIRGADEAGVEVEILDEGSPGNDLGWGRKFARVKVTLRGGAPAVETTEVDEAPADVSEAPAPRPPARKAPAAKSRGADRSERGARDEAAPVKASKDTDTEAPAKRPRASEKPARAAEPQEPVGRKIREGEKALRRPTRPEMSVEDFQDEAHDVLEQIIDLMRLDVSVEDDETADGQLVLNMMGPDQGILIGKHGQTLEALQFILNLILNKDAAERRRVILDAGGYRQRRERTLTDMANRFARRALEERVQIALEPMNPAERRIVHMALADDPDVETFSEGEEPDRKVIISPRH